MPSFHRVTLPHMRLIDHLINSALQTKVSPYSVLLFQGFSPPSKTSGPCRKLGSLSASMHAWISWTFCTKQKKRRVFMAILVLLPRLYLYAPETATMSTVFAATTIVFMWLVQVTSYVLTVPKQRWEFPLLPWGKLHYFISPWSIPPFSLLKYIVQVLDSIYCLPCWSVGPVGLRSNCMV